jgi:hypothetical protein
MATVDLERILDLNIFYEEFYTERLGTWWDNKLTIDAYIYESDAYGTRKYETGVLIKCDEFETQWLAEQFPMEEYGSDFWIFADEVQMPSRRIAKILKSISYSNIYNRDAASIVISDSSTM